MYRALLDWRLPLQMRTPGKSGVLLYCKHRGGGALMGSPMGTIQKSLSRKTSKHNECATVPQTATGDQVE